MLVADGEELSTLAETLDRKVDHGLVKLTPAHLDALDKSMPPATVAADGYLVVGGESLHGGTAAAWRRRIPGLRIVNEYGPTETVVGCCVYEVGEGTDLSLTVPPSVVKGMGTRRATEPPDPREDALQERRAWGPPAPHRRAAAPAQRSDVAATCGPPPSTGRTPRCR